MQILHVTFKMSVSRGTLMAVTYRYFVVIGMHSFALFDLVGWDMCPCSLTAPPVCRERGRNSLLDALINAVRSTCLSFFFFFFLSSLFV